MHAASRPDSAAICTDPKRWQQLWLALGCTPPADLHAYLLAAYDETQRHYHTRQHLDECLQWLDQWRHLANDPATVELALWFHDAIYDVRRADNEQRSADWAGTELRAAGLSESSLRRVMTLVLDTRHQATPESPDGQLLVDIDLAILGASADRFGQYEQQVRREYAHVPEPQFRRERARILGDFLARPRIFNSPIAFEQFESVARANLRWSIGRLSSLGPPNLAGA